MQNINYLQAENSGESGIEQDIPYESRSKYKRNIKQR